MIRRSLPCLLIACLLLVGTSREALGQGFAVYAQGGKVYTVQVGQSPKQLYDGSVAHAVWSAKALYVYFIKSNGQIWRMNNDGSGARQIASGINTPYNPIAAYRPDAESLLYVNGTDFYRVSAADGKMTKIYSGSRWYVGEVAIDDAGDRLVARDDNSDLFKITVGGTATLYDKDCSSSISPDGSRMTSNVSGHVQLTIHNWSGGTHKTLNAPGTPWDNQKFAVNSNDHVVYTLDDDSGIGINQVSADKNTVIKGPKTPYPDLFVGSALPAVGSNPPSDPPPSDPPPSDPPPSDPPPSDPPPSDPPPSDGPGPAGETIVIEAESMTLAGDYTVEGSLIATMSSGTASASFPGAAGRYRLTVTIVEENDGEPTLDVKVGGALIQQVQYGLGDASRSPRAVELGELDLVAGDAIELIGAREGDAAARVDLMTFTLIGDSVSPTDPGEGGPGTDPGAEPGTDPGATPDEPTPAPGSPAAPSEGDAPPDASSPSGDELRLEGAMGCSAAAASGDALPTVVLSMLLLVIARRRRRRGPLTEDA